MSDSPRWNWNASRMGSKHSGSSFQGKSDIQNCSSYRAAKLLEHGMRVRLMVLEKRLRRIVTVDKI